LGNVRELLASAGGGKLMSKETHHPLSAVSSNPARGYIQSRLRLAAVFVSESDGLIISHGNVSNNRRAIVCKLKRQTFDDGPDARKSVCFAHDTAAVLYSTHFKSKTDDNNN
jgi:hypothetical protein